MSVDAADARARARAAGALLDALPHPVAARSTPTAASSRRTRRRRPSSRPRPTCCAAIRSPISCPSAARSSRWSSRCASAARRSTNTASTSARRATAASTSSTSTPRPSLERPDSVVVVLQERTMADKIDRQLTPSRRGAHGHRPCRDARPRDQEPAVRHPRRGAASRILGRRRRPRADPADLRRGRPHREAGRPHGGVLRRAADRARAGQHPRRPRPRAAGWPQSGFARTIQIGDEYDPSLPPVFANRDQLVQVFLNLVKNAAEAIGDAPDGEIVLTTAFKPGFRLSVPGSPSKVTLPLEFCVRDNGAGRAGGPDPAPLRPVRHHQGERHRPRPCPGRQDHRRPWRRHRMRVAAAAAPSSAC